MNAYNPQAYTIPGVDSMQAEMAPPLQWPPLHLAAVGRIAFKRNDAAAAARNRLLEGRFDHRAVGVFGYQGGKRPFALTCGIADDAVDTGFEVGMHFVKRFEIDTCGVVFFLLGCEMLTHSLHRHFRERDICEKAGSEIADIVADFSHAEQGGCAA